MVPSPVRITFRAEADSFAAARDAYEALWRAEGRRIVRVMEQVSGIRFDAFLWLYDAWVTLWGWAFADAQVAVERARRGPYPRAWDAALALDAAGRAARWKALRDR